MLKLDDHFRRRATQKFDGILIAEIVGSLDRVVHMPQPVVLTHVAERRTDTALGSHCVRAGGKHLGEHGSLKARLGQLQRGAQTGAAGTHHDGVEPTNRQSHA